MHVLGEVSEEIKSAARFYASRLMDGRLHRHIHVEIEMDVNLPYAGLCTSDDDSSKPKYFTIQINPACHDHILQCLAHEMVHVKQYATGELIDCLDGVIIWKGKKYTGFKTNYGNDWEHLEWEKIAYGMEEELFEEYLSLEIL